MSKRVFCFGLALSAMTLAFLLADQMFWEPGVTASNVRRIRLGMAVQEVKAILGGPSDDDLEYRRAAAAMAAEAEARLMRLEDLRRRGDPRDNLAVEDREYSSAVVTRAHGVEMKAVPVLAIPAAIIRVWRTDQGTAKVLWDINDKVASAWFEPITQAGVVDQIRSWLGW